MANHQHQLLIACNNCPSYRSGGWNTATHFSKQWPRYHVVVLLAVAILTTCSRNTGQNMNLGNGPRELLYSRPDGSRAFPLRSHLVANQSDPKPLAARVRGLPACGNPAAAPIPAAQSIKAPSLVSSRLVSSSGQAQAQAQLQQQFNPSAEPPRSGHKTAHKSV